MEWSRICADWPHYKLLAQARWAKLGEQELDLIAGRRDALVMRISALYGISRDTAQMQLESWQGRLVAIAPDA
jgi:hypothetical protein